MLIIPFIICISALTTLLLTPVVILLAKKYGFVDNVKKRLHPAHTHKGIIPRAGGLAIFIGLFSSIFLLVDKSSPLTGIFIGATILIIIGLWDDKKDRSPYIRFLFNCLAAIIAISFGINIPYITNPFGGIIHLNNIYFQIVFLNFVTNISLADLVAFIWIIWTTNIVGWSGGVDGQLPGFVAISSLVIGFLSLRFASIDPGALHVTYLSFATAGAFIGFLPWNFYPQKIMPGYGGKTLAGFMLAVLSILSFSKVGTAVLVLAVPMIDAVFIFLSRIFSGKSPVWATRGHLHHHLLNLGWDKRRISLFYWSISAIAGIIALMLNYKQKIFAGALIIVLIVGFILWVNLLLKWTNRKE